MFKIATWNVNSIKVRLEQVLDWLANEQVDVLALQETKTLDEHFPAEAFQDAGFEVSYSGQKTYNGVAIISKRTAADEQKDIPMLSDPQRRILACTYGSLRVINLYVPNGQSPDSDKYQYKLDWLDKVSEFIAIERARYPNLVVLGDFNIAPDDRDVHDPAKWEGSVLVSAPERQAFQRLLDLGLSDSFRLFEQSEKQFSWWDYRRFAFKRNAGMRIDHILISHQLKEHCLGCQIDRIPRKLDRPSDHTPVVAEFSIDFA